MQAFVNRESIQKLFAISMMASFLNGCLSDEVDSEASGNPDTTSVNISGSIGDGPVVGANMRIANSAGELLAEFVSNTGAGYSISVETVDGDFPLSIEATGGTDLVTNRQPDFMLTGAALNTGGSSIANANPFTTVTVALAKNLAGGLTSNNLENAQETVTAALNSGLESLAATGPMGTRIDDQNLSEIVKASETLAEIIRRTRDLLNGAGFSASADDIVNDLAADLPDGVIDGSGTSGADNRTSAVSTIVSAQVLLESMANELHVDGNNATAAMQSAVDQLSTNATMLEQLPITNGMIAKARVGLAAAFTIDPDPAIRQLHSIVTGLSAGGNGASVRFVLPANYRSVLQNAVDTIASADANTLNLVNSIARSNGDIDAENLPPSIQGTPATSALVGNLYSFTPAASDSDGDPLTFGISGQPSWSNFDQSTGQLSGVPAAGDVGVYSNIVISVTDGTDTTGLMPFSVTVSSANTAPQISGTAATSVNAGSNYVFVPVASDDEGDTLAFTIVSQPSWANFNTATGRLSGTPTNADVGTDSGIVISVSDGEFSSSLPAFSITVNAVVSNSPPQISGSPATSVNENESYSFTPGATDSDGDNLTFSISGLPSWASFSTATGRLNGTPGSGDVGVYSNIVISVSDGMASDSLPAFSITVEAIALGSVSLSWTAPTQNEDGTALTDLAGYKLYWGTSPGNYPNSVTINNASVTTYLVENLSPGTYEFVATSFNSIGVESQYSGAATKTVP